MSKSAKSPYLVLIFPEPLSPLGKLADDALQKLRDCCGTVPTLVHPDKNKLALLVEGEEGAIVKALQSVCQKHNDSWLLLPVDSPCIANGLSRAEGWIRSHTVPPQK